MIFFQNKDDLFEFRKNIRFRPCQQFALVNGSGVDLEYFRQQPMPENFSFLLAARLISDKGVLEYANAARYLKGKYPYIKFFLAGWFDQTPYAIKKALVTEWQQEGTIEFLGHVEDIREALKNASVFVLPSLREGTPRSVLEAMASGRPIITTDAPGCRETVREGINGFLIQPKNEYALRLRMEEFVKRPGLLPVMGEASRKIAEEKYDVHMVNDIIIKGMQL
jgi:glycosyltransferase involved in cell wall biosynthesis